MTADVVLAIDLGTGGPKVGLVDSAGDVLGFESEPTSLLLFPSGGVEQDPDEWWSAITTATQRLHARGLVDPKRIGSVSVTAQWMGTVPVNESGEHLHNAVIWLDARGVDHSSRIAGGPASVMGYDVAKIARWLRYTSGAPSLAGKDPIGHIAWLNAEHPDVTERTYKFLEPTDYLNMRLTGRAVASPTTIAGHWVADIRDLGAVEYVPDLIDLAELDRAKLPEIIPDGQIIGTVLPNAARDLGIDPSTRVVTGTPDTISAALGSGAVADNAAHLYVGTSSWISCHTPKKKVDPIHNITTLPSAVTGRYLVSCNQDSAGACLNHLIDNVIYSNDSLGTAKPPDAHDKVIELAATANPGTGGLMYLPWLTGEQSPLGDHRIRGGFVNLALESNRADLARAVLEGVAHNSTLLLPHVERLAGSRFDEITFIGGGAKSRLWAQIISDVMRRPIRRAAEPRMANLRGAAFSALVAAGALSYDDIPGLVEIAEYHSPNPDTEEVYSLNHQRFEKAYKRLRPLSP